MGRSITVIEKRRGRPKVGSVLIGVRLPPVLLVALDRWIAAIDPALSRPAALRLILRRAIIRESEQGEA